MISSTTNAGTGIFDIRGKSTDQKPVNGVPNGSSFYEMDTGNVYMFDGDTNTWIKQ